MTTTRSKTFPIEVGWPLILHDLGVEPRAVLRRAGLPEDLFSRQGVGLSTQEYFRLWSAIEAEADAPAFPIRLGEFVRSEAFHPVLFASLSSSNFSIAARRIAEYKRLIAPMRMHVERTERTLSIWLEWLDHAAAPPASLAAFELVFFVKLIRMATRERVCPLRVESTGPLRPAARYAQFFGVRVEVGPRNRVVFAREDTLRPFLTANESMWRVFEPALRKRLADLEASASLADRVHAALLEALPAGENSMDEIARKLGISKRTLQRRLRAEGATYKEIMNETRAALAHHYLEKTSLSGAEISYLLGFADPNSFFRAFHAWTGRTTREVRPSSG